MSDGSADTTAFATNHTGRERTDARPHHPDRTLYSVNHSIRIFASAARLRLGFPAVVACLLLAQTALATDFYVDPVSGDDARSALLAQSQATAWKTLGRALGAVQSGHRIVALPGDYPESVQTSYAGVTLRASVPGSATLVAPVGATGLIVRHDSFVVEGMVFEGGAHGLRGEAVDDFTVRDCTVVGTTSDGLVLLDSSSVVIEASRVVSSNGEGMRIERTSDLYLRSNLVYDNTGWGIELDNSSTSDPQPPLSTGNIVAFNTLAYNGGAGGGGLRIHNTNADVRDNVFAHNAPFGIKLENTGVSIHHDLFFSNGTSIDPPNYPLGNGLVVADPRFVAPSGVDGTSGGIDTWRDDDYSLAQLAAGQAQQSPAVDAGSGAVVDRDIAGSTRSDAVADQGLADLGFHASAGASTGAPETDPGDATYYVDCATGDDGRSKTDAQNQTLPWRTMRRALMSLTPGDTLVVAAGTCVETGSVEVDVEDLTVRAATSGTVTIVPPSGQTGIDVQAHRTLVEGFVVESDHQGVLAAHSDSDTVLEDVILRDLVVRAPGGGSIAMSGIQVRDATRVTVENCVASGALDRGILMKRVTHSYVRNSLAYANASGWGIDFDNSKTGSVVPLSSGNVAAFNTVHGNANGLRFFNTEGEIRDNAIAANTGLGLRVTSEGVASYVHHNDSFGNGAGGTSNYDLPSGFALENSNLQVDPLFVAPGTGDFALAQVAAGQGADSPLVNRGSDLVADADIGGSTRTDGAADAGVADIGYHEGAPASPYAAGGAGPMPPPALATVYVNCATGSNTVSKIQAQRPWTPWLTVNHALANALSGETIVVQAGTCAERLEIPQTKTGLTIRADVAGTAILAPPVDSDPNTNGNQELPALEVEADGTVIQGLVIRSSDIGVRVSRDAMDEAISDVVLRSLRVEMTTSTMQPVRSKYAVYLRNAVRPVVENSVLLEGDETGLRSENRNHGRDAYVHNNLILGSGEWGIYFFPGNGAPTSTGNVVAFNTVASNGSSGANGGIFLQKSTGEIRDNVVANNSGRGIKTTVAPSLIHHNNLFGQATPLDTTTGDVIWANITTNPAFVNAAGGDYRLSHVAAGQASTSPAIDAGSGTTTAVDISGSTRTDGVVDAGIADLGFHLGAGASTGVPPPAPTPGPSPTPTPTGSPQPGSGKSYYLDPVAGNDGASSGSAQSPASPWRTLNHALIQANAGDVIRLLPGTYAEQADVNDNALTIVGEGPLGSVVIAPPPGVAGVNVENFSDVRIQNLVVQGGSQGVLADHANRIRITGVATITPTTVGIQVRDTTTAWVDSCIVTGAGTDGILLRRTSGAYVRNNLVYTNQEWGISVDNDGDPLPPVSIDNVIAFNTVHRNEDGIRLLNASGEVRDNQITEQVDLGLFMAGPDLFVHHNNFSANGRDRDRETEFADSIFVWDVFGKNPRYLEPDGADGVLGGLGWADDRFELSQTAAGDDFQSQLVDVGSGPVGTRDMSGSTRGDGVADAGTADLGFHYGAAPASGPPPITVSGQLVHTYYVNDLTGDDAATDASARNPATPWRTISHALQRVEAGASIIVARGDYLESVQIQTAGISLLAETAGEVTIRPPSGANALTVEGVTGVRIDGLVLKGGTTGLSALLGSNDLEVRNSIAIGATTDGFRIVDSTGVLIEDSRAIGSAFSGILMRRVQEATIRNNLVYDNGEWGVSLDSSAVGAQTSPLSAGNLVAENTLAFNGMGNLRLANAVAEIRDNLITDTAGVGLRTDTTGSLLLNNGFARDGTLLDPESAIMCEDCSGNRFTEPRYVAVEGADGVRGGAGFADDDFRLAQFAAGQSEQSQAVDAGSDDASALGATGTTATSGAPDTAEIDLGYHYGATERSFAAPAAPLPEAVLYVDANDGDDARSRGQAASAATPWRTIGRALRESTPGDVILIAPGLYAEQLDVDVSDLTLRGTGSAVATRIAPTSKRDGIRVRAEDVVIENLWIDGARRGIYGSGAIDGLTIRDVAISGTRREGISLRRGAHVTLSEVTVSGASSYGIRATDVDSLEIRDARVYANRRAGLALARGEAVVRFGTFFGNEREGIRSMRTDLSLRDSIVAGNETFGLRVRSDETPSTVSFVHFFGNGEDIAPATLPVGEGVAFGADPLLVDADGPDGVLGGTGWLDDDLSLSQIAGGQSLNSPAVDAGSDLASELEVSGSTASNGAPDVGQADLGAHR